MGCTKQFVVDMMFWIVRPLRGNKSVCFFYETQIPLTSTDTIPTRTSKTTTLIFLVCQIVIPNFPSKFPEDALGVQFKILGFQHILSTEEVLKDLEQLLT